MTFDDWVNDDSDGQDATEGSAARARRFEEAARARAQAERERTRLLRRHTWRARAELLRRNGVEREPRAGG